MGSRANLQTLLETTLGSRNVYYQPPASMLLNYPAIVYSRKDINITHADNLVYNRTFIYEVIVVDKDPDSVVVQKVSQIPTCRYDRNYKVDSLNHDVFVINY